MSGSVIKRMYAGFGLIIVLFAVTIVIMTNSMNHIYSNFQAVSTQSLPLVSLSNATSVELLSADKSFKDFLTTQNPDRMQQLRRIFGDAEKSFSQVHGELDRVSQSYPTLSQPLAQLDALQSRYFDDAQTAMGDYEAMLVQQAAIQTATRRFQTLNAELSNGMKDYVDGQSGFAVKLSAKSYFIKLKQAELLTADATASNDVAFVNNAVARSDVVAQELDKAYKDLAKLLPSLPESFEIAKAQFLADVTDADGLLAQYANYLQARTTLYRNIDALAEQIDVALSVLKTFQNTATNNLDTSLQTAADVYDQSVINAIAIGGAVVLFAAIVGFHIAKSVRSPLDRILSTLEALAQGDITRRVEINFNNEFSQVSHHVNTLADNLHDILKRMNLAATNLTQTASSNAETSSDAKLQLHAQREQTASVATAMTEMAHSVEEVARSAQHSLERVKRVESASSEGRAIMSGNITTINQLALRLNDSVDAVAELQQMSSQIGSILDVISNIAEQTNLLALNAAIEAARAGAQGRGFAVVADEVRVLASRTAQSTTEIDAMISRLQSSAKAASEVIQSCMHDMEMSVTQASEANGAMEEIQALILEISEMSNHISQAAAEQSDTSSAIACSLEDINRIADSSHYAMEGIASTSSDLTSLASQQTELVHRFKL